MPVKLQDLETAVQYVSSGPGFHNKALLCKQSGRLFWSSEYDHDFDQWPDDAADPDKYVMVPRQRDLDLGRGLIREFIAQQTPDAWPTVEQIFSREGAYRRYKDWLRQRNLLEDWQAFETRRKRQVLLQWCQREGVEVAEDPRPSDIT